MNCPVCQSNEQRELYASQLSENDRVSFSYTFSPEHNKTFRVVRCVSCGHVYCDPILQSISENYKSVVDEEYLKHENSRKLSAESVLKTIKKIKPQGRLLDVGCATGDLLTVAAQNGFDAEGLELSEWSAKIAAGRGFKIHKEFLKSFAEKSPNTYDVITLMGVIEHFDKPEEEVRHIQKLLKPDGILVLWTGDVDSITSKLLGRKWWYWQGQHIQYFTRSSLERLAKKCGLKPYKMKTYPFSANFETIQNSLRRYSSYRALTALVKPLFKLKPTWNLYIPGEMLFIAKKQS